MNVSVEKLIRGASTYATRYGNSYPLKIRHHGKNRVEVYYTITKGAVRREVGRIFPERVRVDSSFMWVLGLLRGEGLMSSGARSSMYRFAVVNNDPSIIRAVMEVLANSRLINFGNIKRKFIRITYGFQTETNGLADYWAKELGVPLEIIDIARTPHHLKKARYGSCTLIISDVLLRRIIDLLADRIAKSLFISR